MPHRLLATYMPDYFVAIIGMITSTFAQAIDGSGAIPTTITMGSVVAILLWMQSKREEVAAKREEALMGRVSKLEDDAHSKLMTIIEKQIRSQSESEECMENMTNSQVAMNSMLVEVKQVLKQICNDRPCLLGQQINEGAN